MKLSARYIPDRFLPDKAIDVMDEAGSRVRIEAYSARRAAVQGRLHLLEWEQLVSVLDAKDEHVQVSHLCTECWQSAEKEHNMKVGFPGAGMFTVTARETVSAFTLAVNPLRTNW